MPLTAAVTTPDRTETNRQNAQLSTGPRTEAGKDAVRLNALQHGMYAAEVVLPHEDHAAYAALSLQLRSRFHPATTEQEEQVQTLQDARWRLKRIVALEGSLHFYSATKEAENIEEDFGPLDPVTRSVLATASGYQKRAREFDQLWRHEGRLHRLIEKTTRELNGTLAFRPPAPPKRAAEPKPAPPAPRPPAPAPPQPPVGFVPAVSETASAPAAATAPVQAKMPKFSGPQAAQHRKNWLRKQRQLAEARS